MAVKIFYTNIQKDRYAESDGVVPADLVTVADGKCAARVTLNAVPGDVSGTVYAEIPAVMEGRITSFALRLNGGTPAGQILLTTVSPAIDVIGAYLYVFGEEILPATIGPAMYRKTNMRGTYFCTDRLNTPQKIFAIIVGGSGLEGITADVAMLADTH